jgi:hypothetical protein
MGMVVDDLDEHVGEVNPRSDAERKLMARSTEAIVEQSILGALDGRCKKQGRLKPPASLSPAESSRRTANF